MEKLDKVALFNLAINMDIPNLLRWCRSNKVVNDMICEKDPIWNYNLNKYFPTDIEDFLYLNLNPKELFKLLYSLDQLQKKLNLNGSKIKLYRIKSLYLRSKNITEIPKDIKVLTNLKELSIHLPNLKNFQKEILALEGLVSLHVTNYEKMEDVSKDIYQLKNLEVLGLENDKIKTIPNELFLLTKLRSLSLSDNEIEIIPPEIKRLTNLQELILDNNQINSVPEELSELPNLRTLILTRNPIYLEDLPKKVRENVKSLYIKRF